MPLEAEEVQNILTKNITLRSGSPPLPSLPVFLHNFSRKSSGLLQSWILQAVTVLLSSSSKVGGCLLYERLSIAKEFVYRAAEWFNFSEEIKWLSKQKIHVSRQTNGKSKLKSNLAVIKK